jgi:hypothetical protein
MTGVRIQYLKFLGLILLTALLASISGRLLAADSSDPTVLEQQRKIDQLNRQILEMQKEEAALKAKLQAKITVAATPVATPLPALPSPSMNGPLAMTSPTQIDSGLPGVGLLSKEVPALAGLDHIDFNGIFSAIAVAQNNAVSGDKTTRVDMSNAQIIAQKPDGLVQFYLQGGAYDVPALGAAFVPAGRSLDQLWGPLPVAYLKLAPTDNFSIEGGNLPTLIGAEYTFTFENTNIERGLLWNQENAINRGVQLNYSQGPLSSSLSWNNGFYSSSYTWLTGLLSWAINSSNTATIAGGGNLGFTRNNTFVAPNTLNNSEILDLIYTYNNSPWMVQPYFQWTYVPHNSRIGVLESTSTLGGAILASYNIADDWWLAGRFEYIGQTGSTSAGAANLLYGPGSQAMSFTITPTYQYKKFFARPELSFVQTVNATSGSMFGLQGKNPNQIRALFETGFIF